MMKDSTKHLEALLPHLTVVPYVAVCHGGSRQFEYVGPSVATVLGYAPQAFAAADDLVHPADAAAVTEMVAQRPAEAAFACEYRLRHADGHYVWVAENGRFVPNADDGQVRMIGNLADISERKQAEAELDNTRRRFAQALTGTNVVVTSQDRDLVYQWMVNAIGGIEQDTVVGRSTIELLGSEQAAAIDALKREVLESGASREETLHVSLPDGRPYVLEMHVNPVQAADGNTVGVTTMSYDVTEQHALQARLQENERYVDLMLKDSGIAMFVQDLDGRYTWVKNTTIDTPDAVVGKTIADYTPPAVATKMETLRKEAIQTRRMIHSELQIGSAERRTIYDISFEPIFNDKQEVVATALISIDVTKRVEREKIFKLLAENSRDMICLHAPDGNYQYISPAVEQLLGYKPQELLGTNPYELFHPEDIAYIREQSHNQVLEGEEPKPTIYRLRHQSGAYIWFETLSQPIFDDHNKVIGIATTSRDITTRQKLKFTLNEKIRELEESNTELEQFAYVASHDLQEPLRAVSGFLNLLKRMYGDQLADEAAEFVDEAVDGAERMRDLIRGLLAYSRVNRKNQPFASVALQRVLADALANLAVAVAENGAEITAVDLPTITVDPTQMTRVFQNLINNAIKFGGQSPIKIHIDATEQTDAWQFSVSDNGIGIDPQFHERIFTIFQRLHTRDEIPGTGIGLALVRKIIKRHGGDIWVTSEPGQGSTFYFTVAKDLTEGG